MATTKISDATKSLHYLAQKHSKLISIGLDILPSQRYPPSLGLGNYRWTDQLLLATYFQARTGQPPTNGLEYKIGASNGGFDKLHFKVDHQIEYDQIPKENAIDLSLPLNKRAGRQLSINIPIYILDR